MCIDCDLCSKKDFIQCEKNCRSQGKNIKKFFGSVLYLKKLIMQEVHIIVQRLIHHIDQSLVHNQVLYK